MDLDDPWAEAPFSPDDDPWAEVPSPPTDAMAAVEEPTLPEKDALALVEELFGGEAAALARAEKLLNDLFGETPLLGPAQPEPAQPEPAQPQPAQPEPAQPQPAQQEPEYYGPQFPRSSKGQYVYWYMLGIPIGTGTGPQGPLTRGDLAYVELHV